MNNKKSKLTAQNIFARPVGTLRKVGKLFKRNDPCPCGSGKKFKNCHLAQREGETNNADNSSQSS